MHTEITSSPATEELVSSASLTQHYRCEPLRSEVPNQCRRQPSGGVKPSQRLGQHALVEVQQEDGSATAGGHQKQHGDQHQTPHVERVHDLRATWTGSEPRSSPPPDPEHHLSHTQRAAIAEQA